MDQPVNAFDLSPEQQETASLYCNGCSAARSPADMSISAAWPLAPLRSTFRGRWPRMPCANLISCFVAPWKCPWRQGFRTAEDAEKIAKARKQLSALGFEEHVIDRGVRELKPRLNHKQQIRQIASRLGLAPDGDIANLWTSLTETFGGAHQRSFHRSLQVDRRFPRKIPTAVRTVIRGVAVALQGRYVALMRRVEHLAAMTDRKQAAKLFASEIPGALPLQRHFFERLQTADWLPRLAKQGLLGEPLAGPDEGASGGMRFRQWPAGNYLLRMAKVAGRRDPACCRRSLAQGRLFQTP